MTRMDRDGDGWACER
ncbi:excalibur calcium-binding domain-containing protein [Lysinibacillus pakistanensis]